MTIRRPIQQMSLARLEDLYWPPLASRPVQPPVGPAPGFAHLSIHPSGALFAAAQHAGHHPCRGVQPPTARQRSSFDNTVRVWEVASGNLQHTLNHYNDVNTVAFSPDGRQLAKWRRRQDGAAVGSR